jgi:hypothetical protein
VSWVLVDGKVKKRAGKLVGVDYARIHALVQESHAYLMGLTIPKRDQPPSRPPAIRGAILLCLIPVSGPGRGL